jgi:hypothetical protein
LLQLIDEGIEKTSRTGPLSGKLVKMRCKLLVMLAVVLTLAMGEISLIAATLTLPMLRENTWCVMPVIPILGLGIGHAMLLFSTPSTSSKKKKCKQSAKVVAVGTPVTAAATATGGTVALAESEDAAQKIIFETVVRCCSLALLERKGHATIRSAYFYRTTFVAILSLMIPAVICLPLFITTGKTSFWEAEVRALPPCQ